jgi:alkylation response protein AidB-like acyl-CoA dehydrogenase
MPPLLHHKVSVDSYMINGVKKPASLSHMADFFICVSRSGRLTEQRQLKPDSTAPAIVLIPRSEAVTLNQARWAITPFKATDSHSVSFNEVIISSDDIALDLKKITPFTSLALGTFQVMTMACYLGIAKCLMAKISSQFKPYYEL